MRSRPNFLPSQSLPGAEEIQMQPAFESCIRTFEHKFLLRLVKRTN